MSCDCQLIIKENDDDDDVVLSKDVKKMPLGKISKSQIAKGFEALEQIEDAINSGRTSQLAELSSLFYTLIPHSFGRQRPPTIADSDTLRKKMDMLMVTCRQSLVFLLHPRERRRSIVMSMCVCVCLCVCLTASISPESLCWKISMVMQLRLICIEVSL